MTFPGRATHASHPSYPWRTLCGRPMVKDSRPFKDDDTACLICLRIIRQRNRTNSKGR